MSGYENQEAETTIWRLVQRIQIPDQISEAKYSKIARAVTRASRASCRGIGTETSGVRLGPCGSTPFQAQEE